MKRAVSSLRPCRAVCSSAFPAAAAAPSDAWHGRLRLQKPRGQHLLTNARVLDDIVRRAGIRPGDAVLEVGPSTGNLTARLLASPAASVAARAAALGLAHKLTVITGNAMKVDFPKFDVCAANIPYGISSPLITKLLFGPYRFRAATLLLHREFAPRLAAAPGDREFNHLAENVRLVADVRLLVDVSRADKKKEKTTGTIFKREELVMELLLRSKAEERDANAIGSSAVDDGSNAHDRERNDGHNSDDDAAVGFSHEEVVAFKQRIAGEVQSAGLADKRLSRVSNSELLRLIRRFIQRGVRFQ